MQKRYLNVLAVLVLIGITALLSSCTTTGFGFKRDDALLFSGTIETREIRVGSKVGGRVQEVLVQEGQQVDAGQALVRFDMAELQAQKLQAQARIEQQSARLEKLQGAEINEAKIVLANEATSLCHGAAAARNAAETARRTFVEGGLGEDLPIVEIDRSELANGVAAFEMLRRAGLVASNGEARRLIKGGGARLNDAPIEDENRRVTLDDLNAEGVVKLSFGRKKHAVVRPK